MRCQASMNTFRGQPLVPVTSPKRERERWRRAWRPRRGEAGAATLCAHITAALEDGANIDARRQTYGLRARTHRAGARYAPSRDPRDTAGRPGFIPGNPSCTPVEPAPATIALFSSPISPGCRTRSSLGVLTQRGEAHRRSRGRGGSRGSVIARVGVAAPGCSTA